MASTVEPCESKSLGPLSSTLEMFDTFKTSQDEDKDSDEESFHIPLLVCDDDSEIGKEVSSEMGTPCDETEDDILNKFDEDEKISKINETKDTDSNLHKNADLVNDLEQADRDSCEDMGFHDLEVVDEINDDTNNGTSQNSLDKDEVENENIEIETNTKENKTDEVLNKEQVQEEQILETDENIASEEKVLEKNDLEESSSKIVKDEAVMIDESTPMEKDEKILENDTETNEKILENDTETNEEIMQETVQKNTDKLEENQNDRDIVEVDHHNDAEVDNTVQEEKLSKEENKTPNIQLEKEQDLKNILIQDKTGITDEEKIEAENKSPKELTLVNIENIDNKTENIISKIEENISKSLEENNEKLVEENELDSESNEESSKSAVKEIEEEKKEVESTAMDIDDPDTLEGNSELKKPEEKFNSDIKINEKDEDTEKDLACDDLLDISVIRDVDEDDACAIAAEITETHSSEKSDSDEQESKQENETDDMELEQEDSQTSTEREEAMEYDDNTNSCDQDNTNSCDQDNTNSCDQDNTTDNVISDNTSDGESKENESVQNKSKTPELPVDISDSDTNQSTPEAENEKVKEVPVKPLDSDNSVKPEEDLTASKSQDEVPSKPDEESADKQKENVGSLNKRPLSQSEEEEEVAVLKKMRLDEKTEKSNKLEEDKKSISVNNEKTKTLINFEQFMKKRSLGEGKLTRSDLEQFCLQKICEAIMHRTEVGELHQTIKKQENIIESLRKDLAQLTKQTRDLDIVNKKLMNELRNQNGSHKPLVPLKITRSVGLQVKLTVGTEQVNRRRSYTTNTPRTPSTPNNTPNRNRPVPQGNVVRQVAPVAPAANSPRKPQAPAPILSQALQTRPTPPVTKSPAPANKQRPVPIRPKATDSAKPPAKPSAPGVIDLTDEDDRTAKIAANIVTQKNVGIFNKNVKILQNKPPVAKTNNTSPKTVVKPAGVPTKVGMQPRAMTGLPQGVRLTATQMKNGITIPASVVTSNAQGTTQLMYVVQPGSLVNTTAGGGQKAVLLNFQPTNGVLTSTINGSTVSVIPSKTSNSMQLKPMAAPRKHPAPLPLPPPTIINNSLKKLLPKPHLSIKKTETGIILQWRMPYNLDEYEGIASYQLFAYQETNAPPSSDMWRKVGDVKALALPMACTLTQFADKNKYYFAVRSVDVHKRIGAFSDPEEISL